MAPLISVLIPCFNGGRYVGETLESVFRQTYPNIEVVVVNDGSSDNSLDELRRFKRGNFTILDQNRRGAAISRNDAFRASAGAYVQYLDADDILSPNKFQAQMARLAECDGYIASAEWGRFYGTNPNDAQFEPEHVWCDMAPIDWIIASGLKMLFPALWLMPRSIVDAAGGWNERLTLGDDTEFFVRVILKSRGIVFCEGARCYYRSGIAGSLSGKKNRTAWHSMFAAFALSERAVRETEDSERTRRLFAALWQEYAFSSYPYDTFLGDAGIDRARHLDPTLSLKPAGGLLFRLLCHLFGWRRARLLQVAAGRN